LAKPQSITGCLGWGLIWLGLLMLFERQWNVGWSGLLILAGVYYLLAAVRDNRRWAVIPAALFIIVGITVFLWQVGVIEFPLWRIWPLVFGLMGIALLFIWILADTGKWIFLPAGLLFIAAGAGFGLSNWYAWQRLLRRIVNQWYVLLIAAGIILLISHWQARAERN